MLCKNEDKLKFLLYYSAVTKLRLDFSSFHNNTSASLLCHYRMTQWKRSRTRSVRVRGKNHIMIIYFPYLNVARCHSLITQCQKSLDVRVKVVELFMGDDGGQTKTSRLFNLLVRSFYPNLVKDKTAPASADAEPDARALHAVRQPIQAIQQPLNKLTDDAIIQARREKTARLSLERGKKVKEKCCIKLSFQQILPSGRMEAICVELEDDFASRNSKR